MKIIDWKEQAKSAINNGFVLIPLIYGQKLPLRKGWREQYLTLEEIDDLPECGFGIGIILLEGVGEHPIYAFDLDVKAKKIADEFVEAFEMFHGDLIIRTGNAPKILMPFPFTYIP